MTPAVVTLVTLDYPLSLIEFAISLSVFVMALELARGDTSDTKTNVRNVLRRYPWWLAGG